MKKKEKPSNFSMGLTAFSIFILAVSASMIIYANSQIPPGSGDSITNLLQTGTYETSSFDPYASVSESSFETVEDFIEFIRNNQGSSGSYYGLQTLGGARSAEMLSDSSDPAAMPMADGMVKAENSASYDMEDAGGLDYSETNIQVQGVDEADIIKTDGNYIYTITGNTIFIIKAYPGEDAEIVSKIKLDQTPKDIFIKDNKLAVFGNFNDVDFFNEIDFRPKYGMTFFNVYDTTQKNNPELLEELKFEGSYFRARMKGDHVYFVVKSMPDYRIDYPTPLIVRGNDKISMPVTDIHYYNIGYNNPQFITVHSVNIQEPSTEIRSKSVAVEYGQNMYMSKNNIYITYTESVNEWGIQKDITMNLLDDKLTELDKKHIERIKQVDNNILSKYEKDQKIFEVYQTYVNFMTMEEQEELRDRTEALLEQKLSEYDYFEYTVINKMEFKDGEIDIGSNGKVPGHVINQFSMDENGDIFRIATTVNARWSRFGKERTESTNNVYALDSNLEIIGELKGLAEGERIYSTRFMDDKLYMVTFRQVDPFFVIDLSDPRNIRNLGELKIPGFSRYLHPYDKNTIIGIGQDATETGRTKGLKISLFDVTDVSNPKEIAKFVTDERWAQSQALYDHHAFLFSKERELLVIPAYSYEYKYGDSSSEGYNGAFVFRITKDEIELRGLIDHSDGNNNYWQPQVERSLYIEELLYTKSPKLLRINEIEDLNSVKSIELKEDGTSGDIPIY